MKGMRERLRSEQGFILIFAMLMIMLLMVFMTAIVGAVSYTNKVTVEKSEEHQLQLTAQSATVTLKDYFSDPANMALLSGLIGKTQEYDLSGSGLTDKVRATITDSSKPGYVTLTVTAYDETGKEYETSTLLPITAGQAGVNDLIQNMLVAFRPGGNSGLTANKTYTDVVMNGTIIIDNEVYGDYELTQALYDIDGDGDVDDDDAQTVEYKGYAAEKKYTDRNNDNVYKNFINNPSSDPYAVKIQNGTFKELVTTGNLSIYVGNGLSGYGGNTTIASAMGQLYIKGDDNGGGSSISNVTKIGAGGYFKNKTEGKLSKTGSMYIEGVKFNDETELYSRDGVTADLKKLSGKTGDWNIGGDLKYETGNNLLEVNGDIRVYNKSTDMKINNKVSVYGSLVTGTNMKLNVGNELNVSGDVVAAQKSIEASGSGRLNARTLMAGGFIKSAVSNTKLTGYEGYAAFSGGNYAYKAGKDYLKFDMKGSSDKTEISGLTSDSKKNVVVNNKFVSNPGLTNSTKDNAAGLEAFKKMNTLWLSQAQKVYKGGWSSNATKINFAVALLFDDSIKSSISMGAAGADGGGSTKTIDFVQAAAKSEYKVASNNVNENVYNPELGPSDTNKLEWNYQWYESTKDTYVGGMTPLSHELYYTTDDSVLILRDVLQKALGGPSNSENLNINRSSQGEFVNIARTAIPFDGAVDGVEVEYADGTTQWKGITINYPVYGNASSVHLEDVAQAGYASVEPYKDGYLVGRESSTGYPNFGWIQFNNENDSLRIFDGKTNQYVDVGSRPLYFQASAALENGSFEYGSWGDFYLTRDGGQEIKLKNKIIVEYELDSLEEEDLNRVGYVRWFLDPSMKLNFQETSYVEGVAYKTNTNFLARSNVEGTAFEHNGTEYEYGVMPEFYIFCPKPNEEEKTSVEINNRFQGFIIAPWSMIDTETHAASDRNAEVFRGVILCKNFVVAQRGQYNHYKPLSYNSAINAEVFKLPTLEEKG